MRINLAIKSVLLMLFPVVVFAQGINTPIGNILYTTYNIINYIIYILMTAATVVFLWGMVKYIMTGGDEKAKETSKGIIKAGIIGLFLMVAIWGIVRALTGTFFAGSGVSESETIPKGPGYQDPTQGAFGN